MKITVAFLQRSDFSKMSWLGGTSEKRTLLLMRSAYTESFGFALQVGFFSKLFSFFEQIPERVTKY